MTERKPPAKKWESWIEEQIRQAQDDGQFDKLEGAGKPLPGLTEGYDPDWWAKKLVRREKVSILPPSLELLRKVEAEMPRILALPREADVRARLAALNAEIARLNATAIEGPPTRLAPLDVEAIIAQWRRDAAPDRPG
jgi:hypothetical protein